MPDDLIDFTPEMRAQAKDNIARYKAGPMFLPPVVGDPKGFLGAMQLGNASGGTNWPGAGYDPETHIVYAQANQSALSPISLRKPPEGFSDIQLRPRPERYGVSRLGRAGIRQRRRCTAAAPSGCTGARRGSGSSARPPPRRARLTVQGLLAREAALCA